MPDLIYLLAVLACPLMMGGMMLVMMRGNHGHRPPVDNSDEVAQLRAEVEHLRAQKSGDSNSAEQASAGS